MVPNKLCFERNSGRKRQKKPGGTANCQSLPSIDGTQRPLDANEIAKVSAPDHDRAVRGCTPNLLRWTPSSPERFQRIGQGAAHWPDLIACSERGFFAEGNLCVCAEEPMELSDGPCEMEFRRNRRPHLDRFEVLLRLSTAGRNRRRLRMPGRKCSTTDAV